MRVPVGILLLLIVSLGHAEQDLTARGEVLALLKSAGVQEAQLAVQDRKLLRKDPKLFPEDDPLLLDIVRGALDEPLALPKRLEERARALLEREDLGLPTGLLQQATPKHDTGDRVIVWPHDSGVRGAGDTRPLKALHVMTQDAVLRVWGAARAAERGVEMAFEKIDEKERAVLLKTLPAWLRRSNPTEAAKVRQGHEDVARREDLMQAAALWSQVDVMMLDFAWEHLLKEIEQAIPVFLGYGDFIGVIKIDTPSGPVVIRGKQRQGGTDADAFVLIDLGGDDEYRLPKDAKPRPVRVFIDCGGNDLYLSEAHHAWGASLLGLSCHIDLEGDDDYRGRDWSLGCALGGYALLRDKAGHDRYEGGIGTQGVGIFGTGMLRDDAGNDFYNAGAFAQGFGSSAGVGVLVDAAGNDVYLAGREDRDVWRRPSTWVTFAQGSGYSHRFGNQYKDDAGKNRWKITGQIPGGVGMLVDGGGNDRYEADVFGQGSAYWYSLGVLVDLGGDDSYRTTWYGQGVGTHAAAGVLVDVSGNDRYHSYNTSQGCGHDFSVGMLYDYAGNDHYYAHTLSQGAGNALSGLGVLFDWSGDDVYRCRARSWGFGAPVKGKPPEQQPFGLFLDLGGTDRYEQNDKAGAGPDKRWNQPPRGYGVDRR